MRPADDYDEDEPTEPVGYKQPPKRHQFKKGVSGNPRGRPRKRAKPPPSMVLGRATAELIMDESHRLVKVRENGKVEELPVLQAVIRTMQVAALKGNRRAAADTIRLAKAAEDTIHREWSKDIEEFYEMQNGYQEACHRARSRGQPPPQPLPHPHDVTLDYQAMRIICNGPQDKADKDKWDKMHALRRGYVIDVEDLLALPSLPGRPAWSDPSIPVLIGLIDVIDGLYPDERTRRQPGFNLERWRTNSGVRTKPFAEIQRPWDPKYWAKVKARRPR